MREKIVPIEVTPEMMKMLEICKKNKSINPELYAQYDVKRGLRDINGKGVLAGLTEIGEIHAYDTLSDGSSKPCDGKLYYHGYDVEDLIKGFIRDKRFGFEEVTYLLLFGELPNKNELDIFTKTLSHMRTIPPSFVRDIIMQAPSKDMMNALSRGVLTLYAYDDKADDVSLPNVLRQCLQLIAQFPLLSVYGYQAFKYYHENDSFIVHAPKPELSTAENILHMLRNDSQYTELEARILDIALILHAEHGGGNNSTFTTHVVTSSGTDTYSTVAASLGALKGPKHGGANIKVTQMFEDMKKNIKNWNDDKEIEQYLSDLLNKKRSINRDLFTVWVTQFIHFPTREQMFLNHLLRACRKKKAEKTNLICIQGLNDLLRRSSQVNAKCIKVSVQTLTFIRASFTVCLTCRWNCIHLCSQSQELQVGRLTELRNLSIRVKSFVPHIKVSHLIKNMSLLTAEIKNKQSQCNALGLFNSCIKSISNVLKNQTL